MKVYEGAYTKSRFLSLDLEELDNKRVFVIDIVGIPSLIYNRRSVLLERSVNHEANKIMVDHILEKIIDDYEFRASIDYIVLSLNMPKEYIEYYKIIEKLMGKKFFITIQEDIMPVKIYEV